MVGTNFANLLVHNLKLANANDVATTHPSPVTSRSWLLFLDQVVVAVLLDKFFQVHKLSTLHAGKRT